jgi:AcrR family transcriptional regulator
MRQKIALKPRKTPVQSRSKQMMRDIITAAIRILETQGLHKFTTIRVAEVAGISVGSLYQYFPNKQSLLFEIQLQEMRQTWGLLLEIMNSKSIDFNTKIHNIVHSFIESEIKEVNLRKALAEAESIIDRSSEIKKFKFEAFEATLLFFEKNIEYSNTKELQFKTRFFIDVLTATASRYSSVGQVEQKMKWTNQLAAILLFSLKSD